MTRGFEVTRFSLKGPVPDEVTEAVALAMEPLPPDLDHQREVVVHAADALGIDPAILAATRVGDFTVEEAMIALVGYILEEHGA